MARVPKLEPIAPRVWLLRGGLIRTMNAYLIEDAGGAVVYDTGEKRMAGAIAAAAERMGGLKQVVPGHADTDHRGAAPALSALAPVVCHPDAVAQAQGAGGRTYWDMSKLPLAVRLLHRAAHHWVWDGGPVEISGTVRRRRCRRLSSSSWRGTRRGGLWRSADRVALVSDTFYLTTMWGRPTTAHVPHEAYNLDTGQARRSIRALAELDPRVAAPGHLADGTDRPSRARACRSRRRRRRRRALKRWHGESPRPAAVRRVGSRQACSSTRMEEKMRAGSTEPARRITVEPVRRPAVAPAETDRPATPAAPQKASA